MENKRKRYGADFKFKVAIEALKERQTISELTAKFGVLKLPSGKNSCWRKD
jgi:transposase-like protein